MGYIQCNDCKKEVERTASEINKYKPYCRKCSYKHRKRLKVGRTPNTMCELCKKPLYRRPWQLKSHTYISCIKCKPIVQSKHPENWKKIATINYGYRFKKGKRHVRIAKGKDRWNWKGGITSQTKKDRVKFTREISQIVLKRDDYTCQLCGKRGGFLHVDHIKSWSKYIELRFNINNCRTVCRECHYYITFNKPILKDNKWGINTYKHAYLSN